MADSRRLQILRACEARLRPILDDYFDGGIVMLGEVTDLGPDDPPFAITVVPGDDTTKRQGLKFLITMVIDLQAVVRIDIDEPSVKAEHLLADIKRAFELDENALHPTDPRRLVDLITRDSLQRGSTRVLPRDEGMTSVGLSLAYAVDYQETWGNP